MWGPALSGESYQGLPIGKRSFDLFATNDSQAAELSARFLNDTG